MRWLMVGAALVAARGVLAQATAPGVAEVTAYLQDSNSVSARAALRALDRPGATDLPPLVQLMIGVMYLRDGNAGAAVRLFHDTGVRPDTPPSLQPMAWNGLAWAELSRGDFGAARTALEMANSAAPPNPLSTTLLGLIDASEGSLAAALDRLSPIAAELRTAPTLRAVARYGAAFARFHSGDYLGAAAEFRAVADDPVAAGLADDARYASGLALWRSGDRDGAIQVWAAMVNDASADAADTPHVSRGLLRLDASSWIRGGLRRLHTFPIASQDVQLLRILDHNGRAMAQTMLDHLGYDSGAGTDTSNGEAAADGNSGGLAPARAAHRLRIRHAALKAGRVAQASRVSAGAAPGGGGLFTASPTDPTANANPLALRPGMDSRADRPGAPPTNSHGRAVLIALGSVLAAGGLWLRRRQPNTSGR